MDGWKVVIKHTIQQYFSYIVTAHSHPDSKFWYAAEHPLHGQQELL